MQHHRHLAAPQSHDLSGSLVKNLIHHLHFQEMITGPERTELALAAFQSPVREVRRLRVRQPAPFFNEVQIFCLAEAVLDGPIRTLADARALVSQRQPQITAAAKTAGNVAE